MMAACFSNCVGADGRPVHSRRVRRHREVRPGRSATGSPPLMPERSASNQTSRGGQTLRAPQCLVPGQDAHAGKSQSSNGGCSTTSGDLTVLRTTACRRWNRHSDGPEAGQVLYPNFCRTGRHRSQHPCDGRHLVQSHYLVRRPQRCYSSLAADFQSEGQTPIAP